MKIKRTLMNLKYIYEIQEIQRLKYDDSSKFAIRRTDTVQSYPCGYDFMATRLRFDMSPAIASEVNKKVFEYLADPTTDLSIIPLTDNDVSKDVFIRELLSWIVARKNLSRDTHVR
jgi:hypothetical protein